MLTCKEIAYLASESLDRRLPLKKRVAMRLHLVMCKLCSRYVSQIRFVHRAVRGLAEDSTPLGDGPTLSSGARERIRRKLH